MRFLTSPDLGLGLSRSGQTPAQLASQKGHDDVLAVLAQAGVDTRPGDEPQL